MTRYHDLADPNFETVTGRHGRSVRILRDGARVRIPVFLRDGSANLSLSPLQREVARSRSISDAELASCRPGFRYASSYSRADRQALYDAYDAEIGRMRQKGFSYSAHQESEAEAPESMQPHDEDWRRESDSRSLSQVIHDHQTNMATVYAAYDRELAEAWRRS